MPISQQTIRDINRVSAFLARRDVEKPSPTALGGPVDVIMLVGSSLLQTADTAARAFHQGISDKILIAGGIGHSTTDLWDNVRAQPDLSSLDPDGKPESQVLRAVLIARHDVPPSVILVETRSTNCGANAQETKQLLIDQGISAKRLLIIQDPTMQRRTHATFERVWRGDDSVDFFSYAPFVPLAIETETEEWELHPAAWSKSRFISLLLGEISRLTDDAEGYGPKGKDFIEHVDIPIEVATAHQRLREGFGRLSRPIV